MCYVDSNEIHLGAQNILFNWVHKGVTNVANFVTLVAKYHLYGARCNQIVIDKLQNELLCIRKIERYNSTKN